MKLGHVFVTLALFAVLKSSEALFEGLQDTLSDTISYLKEGLNIIQKLEEFVDNTIGEECIFECDKRGFIPRARKDHVPTSNGCGSLDFLFDDNKESFIHVEKEFSLCCDDHDYCYDTCGADKDECDLKFKKCLYATCKGKQNEFFDAKKCRLKAKLFYMAVLGVGCHSYIDAQRQACECVKAPKTEL